MILESDSVVLFSAASMQEIALKSALGKADIHITPREFLDTALASVSCPGAKIEGVWRKLKLDCIDSNRVLPVTHGPDFDPQSR